MPPGRTAERAALGGMVYTPKTSGRVASRKPVLTFCLSNGDPNSGVSLAVLGTGHQDTLEAWSLLLSFFLSNQVDRHTDNPSSETGETGQWPPVSVKVQP